MLASYLWTICFTLIVVGMLIGIESVIRRSRLLYLAGCFCFTAAIGCTAWGFLFVYEITQHPRARTYTEVVTVTDGVVTLKVDGRVHNLNKCFGRNIPEGTKIRVVTGDSGPYVGLYADSITPHFTIVE